MTNANRYNEFFRPILETLIEKHQFAVDRKTEANSGHHFSSNRGRWIQYEARLAQGNQARVALHIDSLDCDRNIQLVEDLLQRREEIESALGPLNWAQERNTRRRRIEITRPGSIDDDADALDEIREWMVENLINFKRVFDPYLKELVG